MKTTVSDRQLASVMRNAPIGMAIVDHHGRFIEVNTAMSDLVGRSATELRGLTWHDLTHPDDRDVGAAEIAELFAGLREHFAVEKRYLRPDGEARWAVTSVSVVRDAVGEPQHRITQHVDITDRKLREAQLRETASMQARAIADLRRLEDAKSMFLTAVSHELRTPLTVIHGLAETLARDGRTTPDEVRRRLERVLVANTRRMTALLDDLLDLDRLASGGSALEPARLDVVDLVAQLVSSSPVHDRTEFDAPIMLLVTTDPHRVALVVNNLLGNVAKYAPDGPVSVRLEPLDGGGFRLRVHDHGPGIPPDQRELVFQPFHRLAADHPNPGTGIGLSLVARIAAMHGGDASIVDSDVGTHVVVSLPDLAEEVGLPQPDTTASAGRGSAAFEDQAAVTGPGAITSGMTAGRILVIDDDPQVRAMFRAALVQAGHDVHEAKDADTAHEILSRQTFDLALLDMDLSDASGVGVASLIRADTRHASTSIVFVSGDSSTEAKLAALDAGGSDYLTKPVSLRELLGRVEAHLRDRSQGIDRSGETAEVRSRLAARVLPLRDAPDLSALSAQLRVLLAEHFPVVDLMLGVDGQPGFTVTANATHTAIRLPLVSNAAPAGVLEVTTTTEHAQQATVVLVDVGPSIAVVVADVLRRVPGTRDTAS